MVKKSTRSWRLYVDFTNLNAVCPKDSYPLPNIDNLIDRSLGFEIFNVMDAYSRYILIPMSKRDEESTSFTSEFGNSYFKMMSFGLKNVEAIFQKLMDKIFENQIGRNIEVYLDDILVKSSKEEDHQGI